MTGAGMPNPLSVSLYLHLSLAVCITTYLASHLRVGTTRCTVVAESLTLCKDDTVLQEKILNTMLELDRQQLCASERQQPSVQQALETLTAIVGEADSLEADVAALAKKVIAGSR